MSYIADFNAVRQVELQRMEIGLQQRLDPLVVQNFQFREMESEVLRSLIFEIRGHFWAQNPKEISFSYPRDWREAFKQRWFPRWALDRWPVVLTTKTLKGQLFYPLLPQTDPKNAYRIQFAVFDSPNSKVYA